MLILFMFILFSWPRFLKILSLVGWGNWLGRNVGNIYFLNHKDEPMDVTQALVCTRVCTRARFMLVNIFICQFTVSRKLKSKRNDGVKTELSASDAAYSLRDKERRIYFNVC